jgi:hypothetical protein
MMRNGDTVLGTIDWESSQHGGNGWLTGAAASADGTMLLCWADVCQTYKKAVDDDEWIGLCRAGKVPSGVISTNYPGGVAGGYHAGFGGTSNTRIYMTTRDRVVVTSDGENFTNTAIIGLAVDANGGGGRAYGNKGSTDPTDEDVYYIFMGQHGLRYTLDAGATMVDGSWCPDPSHPADATHRYGLIAVDPTSALVGGAGTRHSRVAFAPCGQGVWLSEDGGVTGTNITAASGIEAVSGLVWINGALYACKCDKTNPGVVPVNNIMKWTSGGGWVSIDPALGSNYEYQFIVPDPRYSAGGGYWAVRQSQDFIHTQNGSTFVAFVGDGALARAFNQTKPRHRPLVASKYRYDHNGFATSCWVVAGGYVWAPIGLGITRTPLASFPLAGASASSDVYSSAWPEWEEDCAGIEEIVGQCVVWAGDKLICGGQDLRITHWEDGSRGHGSTVHKYPTFLSDAHCLSVGPDEDYIICRSTRAGQNNTPGFCYTTDGYNWVLPPNQPAQGPAAVWECGGCAAGPVGKALVFPSRYGCKPQYTADNGATPWQDINFFLEGDVPIDLDTATDGYYGFQGSNFSDMHHLVAHDNANPGNFYVVNIGATANVAPDSDWMFDPLGWAGIYHMAPGDFGNFRRIHDGHPAWFANWAFYDTKLLCDGLGHLVFRSNYLPGDPLNSGNRVAVYTIATDTISLISGVRNTVSMAFGAPFPGDSNPCLWLLGWSYPGGVYGLYYSRDLGATVVGPFSTDMPGGGFAKYIDAHKTKWGRLAVAVNSRGHAIGQYRLRVA